MVKERKCRRVHRFQQKTVHIVSIVSSRIEANGHTRRSLFDQFSSHLTYYPFFSESKTSLFLQSIVSKESVKRTPICICVCVYTHSPPPHIHREFSRSLVGEILRKNTWKDSEKNRIDIRCTYKGDIVGHCWTLYRLFRSFLRGRKPTRGGLVDLLSSPHTYSARHCHCLLLYRRVNLFMALVCCTIHSYEWNRNSTSNINDRDV